MGQIFDSSILGGHYILPPDVKPAPGGPANWRAGLVITTTARDLRLKNFRGAKKSRYFPIFREDVDRLIATGVNNKIMLRVENLTDRDTVYIAWLPYDPNNINTDQFDYFIVEAKYLNGNNPPDEPNGILKAKGDMLAAAIGKNANKFAVIINQISGFVNNPGGGGDPPGSGIEIPPM